MGGGYGFPYCTGHCRSLAKAGCTRHFRLYQSTRNLLRCSRPVVREPSSLADRSPVDYLYKRCRTGSVGHYQSPDRTGRQGNRPDSGIQLLLLLCNPHNPVGRVWTPEELRHIGDICLRNGVFVVADEIHCELTYEGYDYTPFASLSKRFQQNSVTCVSPSKAFNLAGLQIANIIAADDDVRRRIDRAININEVCDVNPFGVIATIASYNEGGEWLDALRKYLRGNYEYLCHFFEQRLPQYPVLPLEGTYLVWIDCRALGIGSDAMTLRLQEEQKLMINSGTMYGPGGEGFIRLNIACPRTLLVEGLERMARVLEQNEE